MRFSSILTLCIALLVAPSGVRPEVVLRLGTVAPGASPWGVMAGNIAAELQDLSGGTLSLNVLADGQLGEEKVILRQTMKGRLDLAMVSGVQLALIDEEMSLLSAPYLYRSKRQGNCVATEHLSGMLEERFAAANLVPLAWFEVGETAIFSRREARLPADFSGARIRVSETVTDHAFSRRLGVVGVPLGISDTMVALQSGNVAAGFLPIVFGIGIGAHEMAPHVILTGQAQVYGVIAISKGVHDGLSAQERMWLRQATAIAADLSETIAATEAALLQSLGPAGAHAQALGPEEQAIWRAKGEGVAQELAISMGPGAVALLDEIDAAKQACGP